jgi:hypothetical protein
MKKWLLIIAISLAGLLALIVVIGALLPKKHRISRTVRFLQPAETVWDLMVGPPTWRNDVKSYQELPPQDGHRMWRETDRHGQTIKYEAMESFPPRRMVVRIADPELPFGGTWTYELSPAAGGCTLTITEDGEVYNPLFRFVSRFVIGHSATLDAYIKALDQKLGS